VGSGFESRAAHRGSANKTPLTVGPPSGALCRYYNNPYNNAAGSVRGCLGRPRGRTLRDVLDAIFYLNASAFKAPKTLRSAPRG